MAPYRALCNHDELVAGQDYEVSDAELPQWQGSIDLGFLVPVYEPPPIEDTGYVESGPVVEAAEPEPSE